MPGERFQLTREPVPKVQAAMWALAIPDRLSILKSIVGNGQLAIPDIKAGLNNPQKLVPQTFHERIKILSLTGLIRKIGAGVYEETDLGRVALDALPQYNRTINESVAIATAIECRAEGSNKDADRLLEHWEKNAEQSKNTVYVRRMMIIHGNRIDLNVLLGVPIHDPESPGTIKEFIKKRRAAAISGAQVTKSLSRLQGEKLVELKDGALLRLTPHGEASLDAYNSFQEKLVPTIEISSNSD